MRRFIIISLLAMMATDLLACAIPGTHNYYLFSTVGRTDWSDTALSLTMDNWCAYAGRQDIHWFDADEMRKIARSKNDALMVSYINQLDKYLKISSEMRDTWNYPTKKQLQVRRQTLTGIRQFAFSKTNTRLRSQFALLYMRCNMVLGQHQTNVKFWEQTASKYINTVYRDMMRNIYAGALLKTGRTDEATQIYAEQGDISSLYTYYYKRRSFEAIRQEYQRNPNSAALPFLLQDFANNAQEAIDAQSDDNFEGKLFVRDIKKAEAMQMSDFAAQVVNEGKTKNPALWKSLEAWLQYLFDNKQTALKSIRKAVDMEGLPRVKDNARVLRLFIEASQSKVDKKLDDFLATELEWLEAKAREERGTDSFYENHYTQAYDRLVHQVLVDNYDKAGRHHEAVAFLAVNDHLPMMFYKERQELSDMDWNANYSTEYFYKIDHSPVDQLIGYLGFVQKKPSSALDKWLLARVDTDAEFLNEVIGTKYLRLGQWANAEKYLSKVSLDFVNTMNIVPFMARRDFRVEPWMKRQRIKSELQMPGTAKTTHHQKLEFVREMQQLEQGFGAMEPTAKAKRAYDLAVRYTQASYAGDAWYLSRYGVGYGDTVRTDELDMLRKASELLTVAESLSDLKWKEKVLFAQAFLPMDSWFTQEWNDKKADFVNVPHPETHQYRALQAVVDFERQHPSATSAYVSRCDVLKQFKKAQNAK